MDFTRRVALEVVLLRYRDQLKATNLEFGSLALECCPVGRIRR